jgi:HSP20 family protein
MTKEVRTVAVVRWEPVRELDTLQGEVNRLFDTFFGGARPGAGGNGSYLRRWVPAMDLVETDEHLVLKADLPGLTRDDVAIEVKDRVLTVSGERKAEHESKGEGFYRMERAFGTFSRSLTLPDGIATDAITADFKDGVLEIRIPKPEERKPYRVAIGESVEGTGTER